MKTKLILTALAVSIFGPLGFAVLLFTCAPGVLGTSYSAINAQTKADIISKSPQGEEILWKHEILKAAAQNSPFADNMTGGIGSGKPIIMYNDTTKVVGTQIVIPTVESLSGPGSYGAAERTGTEEALKPGNFLLTVNMWATAVGIQNTALAQTIVGASWDPLTQTLLAKRVAKKQSDDHIQTLAASATSDNTIYPNGKSLDTLSSTDTYQTSVIVRGGALLKSLGAQPLNARPNSASAAGMLLPPIPRYMQFLTDDCASPIKEESTYLDGIKLGAERGENNNLFSGEYAVWDNNIIYPWINVHHGANGSIGSTLQPEAKLGMAIAAKSSTTTLPSALDGGGSVAAAAELPAREYFEFFSLFAYKSINGLTQTIGTGTRYFAVIASDDQKVSFFSFTGNTGHQLTGLTRLGSTTAGNYATTVGSVTWNSGAWTTAADGDGFMGVSEAAIPVGSYIVETNAKGVPIGRALGLGQMAAVCGYGKLPNGKAMASRIEYLAPYGVAKGVGMELSYGSAAFKRPDGVTPNFIVEVFARRVPNMPSVA